jgi:hypothetical protein
MKKPAIIFIAIPIIVALLSYATYSFINRTSEKSAATYSDVMDQAQNFNKTSNQNCADVETPAVNQKTGETTTFPSSCLPEDWEEVKESLKPTPTPDPTKPSSPQQNTGTQQTQNSQTQAEAIEQARRYQPPPDMMCTSVMTPAIHTASGARYTFSNGCLPEGWQREQTQTY